MRSLNIASLCHVKQSLSEASIKAFLTLNGIEIKKKEIDDIGILVQCLLQAGLSIGQLDDFYVGYKIPQIGKEFDLLKFGKKIILNIEVKSEAVPEKIGVQLSRNRYYLESTGRKVESFAFVSSSNILYSCDEGGVLQEVGFDCLIEKIRSIDEVEIAKIDSLFNPSEFLVSPFNSTEKFINSQYFLTHQQEEIKLRITKGINPISGPAFFSISGGPGTGKTLLLYDIARSVSMSGHSVLIVHCGTLNAGHLELNKSIFNIIPAKDISQATLEQYDVIVVDEGQRIYPQQLDLIIQSVEKKGGFCVLSHDSQQTLAKFEAQRNTVARILEIPHIKTDSLTNKIRSNAELASFIIMLQSRNRKLDAKIQNNIVVNYFKDIDSAESYLSSLEDSAWELLRFTPSRYNNEYHEKYYKTRGQTSHQVIGQEFDRVAVVIDNFFGYDEEGYLVYRGVAYYDPERMLFQNLTRAKQMLNIIIVNNEEILMRCADILTQERK
jgi:hypothetical protein